MLIKVTKWEALRIAGILRSREVVTSQYDWSDAVADRIESAVAKEVERRNSQRPNPEGLGLRVKETASHALTRGLEQKGNLK